MLHLITSIFQQQNCMPELHWLTDNVSLCTLAHWLPYVATNVHKRGQLIAVNMPTISTTVKVKLKGTTHSTFLRGNPITGALKYDTHCRGITQFHLIQTLWSTNGMNHTCLCRLGKSWSLCTKKGASYFKYTLQCAEVQWSTLDLSICIYKLLSGFKCP